MCKKNGITVVVITHNQEISAMGDKVIKIKMVSLTVLLLMTILFQ